MHMKLNVYIYMKRYISIPMKFYMSLHMKLHVIMPMKMFNEHGVRIFARGSFYLTNKENS